MIKLPYEYLKLPYEYRRRATELEALPPEELAWMVASLEYARDRQREAPQKGQSPERR